MPAFACEKGLTQCGVGQLEARAQSPQTSEAPGESLTSIQGLKQPATCSQAPELRMVFAYLDGWGKKVKEEYRFMTCKKLYEIQISVFVNKIVLKHNRTHLFTASTQYGTADSLWQKLQRQKYLLSA